MDPNIREIRKQPTTSSVVSEEQCARQDSDQVRAATLILDVDGKSKKQPDEKDEHDRPVQDIKECEPLTVSEEAGDDEESSKKVEHCNESDEFLEEQPQPEETLNRVELCDEGDEFLEDQPLPEKSSKQVELCDESDQCFKEQLKSQDKSANQSLSHQPKSKREGQVTEGVGVYAPPLEGSRNAENEDATAVMLSQLRRGNPLSMSRPGAFAAYPSPRVQPLEELPALAPEESNYIPSLPPEPEMIPLEAEIVPQSTTDGDQSLEIDLVEDDQTPVGDVAVESGDADPGKLNQRERRFIMKGILCFASLAAVFVSVVVGLQLSNSPDTNQPPTLSQELGLEWDTKQLVILIVLQVSAILSIVGSTLIIVMSRVNMNMLYHRLLLAVSVSDLISSVTVLVFPLMVRSDDSVLYRPYALGNVATCTASGLFYIIGAHLSAFYNFYLSLFFLCVIRFQQRIASLLRFEMFLHLFAVLAVFPMHIYAASTESFNPFTFLPVCIYNEYPKDCVDDGDYSDCIRPKGTYVVMKSLSQAFIAFLALVSLFCVVAVYCKIWRVFGRNSNVFQSGNEKARLMAVQCLLYFVAYTNWMLWSVFVYIYLEVGRVTNPDGTDEGVVTSMLLRMKNGDPTQYFLQFMMALMMPLQGAINYFVYSRPKTVRLRKQYPDQSYWWIFCKMVLEGTE